MELLKQQEAVRTPCAADEADLALINRLTRAPLTAEQVYTFAVRLCDNEVDRDFERFDEQALSALGDLFVGKTGLFDHRWSAEGQTARIFKTELVREPHRATAAGDGYCWLKGWAYLLRGGKTADLIAEIDGGIKKEVSVGCAVRRSICSVCGADSGTCEHIKGREYGGKLCYTELRDPSDAYEWSFVAVPAQKEAGVVKKYTGRGRDGEDLNLLRYQAQLGRGYLASLRREVTRLAMLCDGGLDGETFRRVADRLEAPELLELQKGYQARVRELYPMRPQLRPRAAAEQSENESAFRV